MKSQLPVDIFAVKEYGIDKWQREFFCPISDDEFITLYRDVEQCLVDEINRQTGQLKALLIIQYKFLNLEYAIFASIVVLVGVGVGV